MTEPTNIYQQLEIPQITVSFTTSVAEFITEQCFIQVRANTIEECHTALKEVKTLFRK